MMTAPRLLLALALLAASLAACGGPGATDNPPCVRLLDRRLAWIDQECQERRWDCCPCSCAARGLVGVVQPSGACSCELPDYDTQAAAGEPQQEWCLDCLVGSWCRDNTLDALQAQCVGVAP